MKNRNKDKYGLLILKALKFFIENPYDEIHLRGFSRKLNISPNTAQRFLDKFSKEGLIKEERKANLRYFKANMENIVFRKIKIAFSVKMLVDAGLMELKESASNVVLFGSMASGEEDKKSDVDLLIVSQNKVKSKEILGKLDGRIDREIQSHIFSWQEWKKQAKINKAFYNDIIIKGINFIGEMPIVG